MPTDEDGLTRRFEQLATLDVSSAFRPFDESELDLLGEYHQLVAGITGRPLFAEGIKFSFSSGKGNDGAILDHAGEDALRSTMIDFRRLWMNKEPTNFHHVLGLVRDHADEPTRGVLAQLGRDFKDACRDPMLMIRDPEDPENPTKFTPVRSRRVVDDWLNGKAFHGDVEARRRVEGWSEPAYEFSLIKAVNRISNVALALDVPIAVILAGAGQSSPAA